METSRNILRGSQEDGRLTMVPMKSTDPRPAVACRSLTGSPHTNTRLHNQLKGPPTVQLQSPLTFDLQEKQPHLPAVNTHTAEAGLITPSVRTTSVK